MLTWVIVGTGLPDLKIRARSFDEALAKAKLRDSRYCAAMWPMMNEGVI